MAYIRKRLGKFTVAIRRRYGQRIYKTFDRKSDAHYDHVVADAKQMQGLKDRLNNSRKFAGKIEPDYSDPEDDPRYIDPLEMQKIKEAIPVLPMVKKKIKKTLVVEKPKKPIYINDNVIDITPLIDDEWWEILGEEAPKEESRLLLVPKSKAEGITSILNLHKKFAG